VAACLCWRDLASAPGLTLTALMVTELSLTGRALAVATSARPDTAVESRAAVPTTTNSGVSILVLFK
jgi:hypothetical protein